MNQKKQLTISEFAKLTGIKRDNLRFYDRIGLLSPDTRGENNYRYYSRQQLNTAYLISNLRGLGVGIDDIKHYAAERTPEKTLALFVQQDKRILAEIRQLREMRQIMTMHSDMVKEAMTHVLNEPFLLEQDAEPIFLCPPIPDGMNDDEGGIYSYEYADANGVNLGYPQGNMIPQRNLEMSNTSVDFSYYFKVPSGNNDKKPAGLYAVIYGHGNLWKTEAIYERLFEFIEKEKLKVCGNAYEEYPLTGLAEQAPDQSDIRIEVLVTRC